MRALILAALLSLPAAPALAAGAKPTAAAEGSHVDVAPFGVPVVINGKVVNYVFVSVRLHAAPKAETDVLKAKEPRFREALVRAAHRAPLNPPGDRSSVDELRLSAMALAEARRIGGAKTFVRAEIRKQTPQRRMSPVRPA